MIDPSKTCLFIPANLKAFKLKLFERIGANLGRVIRGDVREMTSLPSDIIPIVGCSPELTETINGWRSSGRQWIYWDRGYCRRVFATDLPTGSDGGYYRWHLNSFQMQRTSIKPSDRWRSMDTEVWNWSKSGIHIVVAEPSPTYQKFHGIEGWTERTVHALRQYTGRPLVIRDKEMQRFGRKLHQDLKGAHCLVTHGSNAAVESAIMGCPVYVDKSSAAALIGQTDLSKIETPVYPDRQPWLNSLAYSQWNERELVDGTLWRMLE